MKRLFFVLLLLSIVAVSGCLETNSEKTAIDLSNSTIEGKLASTLMDSLKKTSECTATDYKNVASLANPLLKSSGLTVSLPTEDSKAIELVNNSIECNVQLSRNVLEIEKSKKYQVNYAVKAENSCKFAELKNAASSYTLSIDVDVEAKKAVVSKGKLKDSVASQAENFQPAFGLLGNCTAPVLLGVGLFGDFLGAGNQNISSGNAGNEGTADQNIANENSNENSTETGNQVDENAVSENDSKTAYDFDAWWDETAENPIQLSWNHTEKSEQYYVAIEMWTSGNSSPLGSIEDTVQKLKQGTPFPLSHVFNYNEDGGGIYYGGNLSYPHQFKVSAYLLDSSYNIVEKFGYKEFSINAPEVAAPPSATDIASDFEAQWDATDAQHPLKFNWNYNAESGKYYVALDMWNTGNSSPLGSIQSTIQNLKNGSPFPPSHVYGAENESGTLYWGGQYTYPDVFKIHAYLLNDQYDNLGEIAYVQITRNNASESPTSVPI